MTVSGWKIKKLIEMYGAEKGYPEKSYLTRFCEDYKLNYNQWNAYLRESQNMGSKVIQFLMEVFPNVDLNWLLKETDPKADPVKNSMVAEEDPKYSRATIDDLYRRYADLRKKLDEIHRLSTP